MVLALSQINFIMPEIKPNEIYTTEEARDFLKISESTIKRMLKKGIIKAYKVGGQYRIWGSEILRLVSPELESGVYKVYKRIRDKTRKTIEKW
jgi:excisionase family DNA binding protein